MDQPTPKDSKDQISAICPRETTLESNAIKKCIDAHGNRVPKTTI